MPSNSLYQSQRVSRLRILIQSNPAKLALIVLFAGWVEVTDAP
jgi:hypothetical protein